MFCNIKSYTSTKSKSPAGRELYRLAKQLLAVKTTIDRDKWIVDFYTWTKKYEDFLAEKTLTDTGKYADTHERLVKARNLLIRLIKKGEMFTFLEPDLYSDNERVGACQVFCVSGVWFVILLGIFRGSLGLVLVVLSASYSRLVLR
ncbi:Uncharacterised protein [Mobiluncus mulieris]|nr:Uncharacterised protein [Mobiluncus mulieris]